MNLIEYLPLYYRTIAEIIVLQKTIQEELETANLKLDDLMKQFFIQTASWSLPIWEQSFGLPVGDDKTNYQERRENIISKLRSYGTTTKEMIIRVGNAFTNGGVTIKEYNEQYRFEVIFTNTLGIPKNMEIFKQTIEVIKPAHLTYDIVFKFRTHKGISKFTHGQLTQYQHIELREKNDI